MATAAVVASRNCFTLLSQFRAVTRSGSTLDVRSQIPCRNSSLVFFPKNYRRCDAGDKVATIIKLICAHILFFGEFASASSLCCQNKSTRIQKSGRITQLNPKIWPSDLIQIKSAAATLVAHWSRAEKYAFRNGRRATARLRMIVSRSALELTEVRCSCPPRTQGSSAAITVAAAAY